MAEEGNEDNEAAANDPLDDQLQTLKGDNIPKSTIDAIIDGLRGKKSLFTSVTGDCTGSYI